MVKTWAVDLKRHEKSRWSA